MDGVLIIKLSPIPFEAMQRAWRVKGAARSRNVLMQTFFIDVALGSKQRKPPIKRGLSGTVIATDKGNNRGLFHG